MAVQLKGRTPWFLQKSACSVQLQRAGVELVIRPFQGQQVFMRAALNNPAVIEDHDRVRILHCTEPVGDDKYRPSVISASMPSVQSLRCGYQSRLVASSVSSPAGRPRGSGNGKELPLPLRFAPLPERGVS